jgi:hypothetical protein
MIPDFASLIWATCFVDPGYCNFNLGKPFS